MGDDEDGVADGDDRFLLAAAGDEPVVQGSEVGVTRSAAGVGGLDERSAKPGITLARLSTFAFASTFVIARTHARPGSEVGRGGEPGHVEPDLGDDDFGGPSTDAWDGVQ